jgi:antagonist of KipI
VIAPRMAEAGDSGLLLELDEVIDADVNARAIAIAAAFARENLPGVRDVVPTYRTVAVHFDPLRLDIHVVRAALERASGAAPTETSRPAIEIPVRYGGDDGPDLVEVARFAELSVEDAIRAHAETPYRVFMLGFLPGFAYMGTVDARIAMPRRATPRLRVPAGSVAIAGQQTGVYPSESPGGWRLIGRTPELVFDAIRPQPSLFTPGDVVRFVPTRDGEVRRPARAAHTITAALGAGDRHITILRPGLFTTIQDLGRWGQQANGVPVGGALDRVSHAIANATVGNDGRAATLEVTVVGPEIRIESDGLVAISGANLGARLDGADVPLNTPVACRAGAVLHFGQRTIGARCYVAFDGGVDVAPVLDSRSTSVRCAIGGLDGRALAAGDRLPIGPVAGSRRRRLFRQPPPPSGGARLRVVPGPQTSFFPDDALEILQGTRFTVTPHADRMGYRLEGTRIPRLERREMISDATFTGGIQVPASGEPILLMADRQTTGGYPQIATVITADLPLAGQLAPGDWVEFSVCTRREALTALVAQEGQLLALG